MKYNKLVRDKIPEYIKSFADKVKGSPNTGLQFKQIAKSDPLKEILQQHPEIYKQLYAGNAD